MRSDQARSNHSKKWSGCLCLNIPCEIAQIKHFRKSRGRLLQLTKKNFRTQRFTCWWVFLLHFSETLYCKIFNNQYYSLNNLLKCFFTFNCYKMPNSCCVPGCRGNYRSGPRVTVFSFPDKKKSPHLYKKWLHAIKRKNFTPNKYTKVRNMFDLQLNRAFCNRFKSTK